MNKQRLLIIIVIALVISNIMMLVPMLMHGPPPPKDGPKRMIIDRLGLDEDQIARYEDLIKTHQAQVPPEEERLMAAKTVLYSNLLSSNDQAVIDSLAAEVGKHQTELEKIHYAHFRELKAICKEEQEAAFETLVKELAGLFRLTMKENLKKKK